MNDLFCEIPGSNDWKKVKPIQKGWSGDHKYYVESADHRKFLLRVSIISNFDRRQSEYDTLKRCYSNEIVMPEPIGFGVCSRGQNVYTLLTWVDGDDAGRVLPALSEKEQYRLGYSAGQMLKRIHQNPAPDELPPWSETFNRKIDRKIKAYRDCGIRLDYDGRLIKYIESNRHLLDYRPQSVQHGDYHCGNMVISSEHQVGIVDFDRLDYGDPWEEFNRITWSADVSPAFASGQINGYFDDDVPDTFFRLMALYIAVNQVSSIPWAIPFGQSQVNVMMDQSRKVLEAYDQYQNYIPKWYSFRK
ncbi:phosphotransferase family protein [Sporolactobacillus shoreae]|uniref:Phosphotransferase family protein n=1 Tax=Sporolactobacillus shoreae TaxID=1465501 RepID=A0A4Z0GPS2_9BACL|nr:phosphotransferase family protein [Sporolactobacillus shoreae]TGA98268.1 phosphotransferase family protein [Sporolactobacillus shoreae]